MDRNEITANIREQEDQAMAPLIAFDKEKAIRYAKANTKEWISLEVLSNACRKIRATYQRGQWKDK